MDYETKMKAADTLERMAPGSRLAKSIRSGAKYDKFVFDVARDLQNRIYAWTDHFQTINADPACWEWRQCA